ncbi:MAG TPA: histidine triad nucleotide-binding protein [Clostridiaceae bacterium]|jgi:histidine triad (HIT) family protein|nr:histidine triad nucleotide-binding protein [Clostridiaceae bacterium]
MDNCIFCKIVRGEIPSTKIYEDDNVLAFKDLHPVSPVHVLIIPKIHFANLHVMSASEEGLKALGEIYRALPEIVRLVGLEEKGFRLINNCGASAGQSVMHTHFHLIGGRSLGTRIL